MYDRWGTGVYQMCERKYFPIGCGVLLRCNNPQTGLYLYTVRQGMIPVTEPDNKDENVTRRVACVDR